MEIKSQELKDRIHKRLPMLTKKDVDYYFRSIVQVLVARFVCNQPVIIDNFGTLARKKTKPRKILNVNTGEHQEIISNTVFLRPNYAFLAFFRDKKNRSKLMKKIIEKSAIAFNEMKNCRRKNLI